MTMKIVFVALAIAAGVAAAMQAATNAGLSKSAGLGPALVVNTVIVLIGAIGLNHVRWNLAFTPAVEAGWRLARPY